MSGELDSKRLTGESPDARKSSSPIKPHSWRIIGGNATYTYVIDEYTGAVEDVVEKPNAFKIIPEYSKQSESPSANETIEYKKMSNHFIDLQCPLVTQRF